MGLQPMTSRTRALYIPKYFNFPVVGAIILWLNSPDKKAEPMLIQKLERTAF